MDDRHFDALVRALRAPDSRRTLLTLLGSGFSLLTLAGFGSPDAMAKKKGKKRKKRKQRKNKQRNKAKGACSDVCVSGCAYSSVQDVIDAARAGDTLRLCAGTYGGTITIDKDVTVIGAGDGEDGTILDGQGNGPVVFIASGVTVTLENVRITGGSIGEASEANGGGIDIGSNGGIALTGCTVTGNQGRFGGGIGSNDGILSLTDCMVSGNTAALRGGGIASSYRVTLTNSIVADNHILEGSSVGNGGGIAIEGGSLTLTDSRVTDNSAVSDGGGIINFEGKVTLNDSIVTGNSAGGTGGGIWNGETVILNGASSVTDNEPNDCVNVHGGTGCP